MSTDERKIRNEINHNFTEREVCVLQAESETKSQLERQILYERSLLSEISELREIKAQKASRIELLKQEIIMIESGDKRSNENAGLAHRIACIQEQISEERKKIESRNSERLKEREEREQKEKSNKERKESVLKEMEKLRAVIETKRCEEEEKERKQKELEEDQKRQRAIAQLKAEEQQRMLSRWFHTRPR